MMDEDEPGEVMALRERGRVPIVGEDGWFETSLMDELERDKETRAWDRKVIGCRGHEDAR